MSAARDYQSLPAILLDSDWVLDFLFFGKDVTEVYNFPADATFSCVLAPAGKAGPPAGQVIEVTSADFISFPAQNNPKILVPKASLEAWAPGPYDVQLRRIGPAGVFEALYIGTVAAFTGLSQLATLGRRGKQGRPPGVPGTIQVFRDSDQVRVVRGEAAGSAAAANEAWQAIDPVVTAIAPINVVIPAGQARDVFAANASPKVRWARNRGPNDATVVTGADAVGANTEIELPAGELYEPPYRSGLRVSMFSALGTTIEGEEGT